jgi:hypothetical protein
VLKLVMSIAQSVLTRFLYKLVHCDHKKKGYKLITKIPAGFDGLPVQFTKYTCRFVYPCFLPAIAERLKGRSCLGSCDLSFIHYFLGLIIELTIVQGSSTSNNGWVGAWGGV